MRKITEAPCPECGHAASAHFNPGCGQNNDDGSSCWCETSQIDIIRDAYLRATYELAAENKRMLEKLLKVAK